MDKVNRSVVRNQAYRKSEISIRERHNERENETYYNSDIQLDRSHLNVHFKSCTGTYEQTFNRMVEDSTISLRGLKADAKVFDELVFDVNTEYFDRNGGYEYAKTFFEETYKLAVREVGGEDFILSAVMHADERNKALSEQLGRDVYHYHLHVIYAPVVDKEIYFKKNNKNPELAGKLKEVVKQVSHSKKWPRFKDDKGHWVNSYSLLQDRFHEYMKEAGFVGFERGERGSTAEHLDVLDYKIKQDEARAAALDKSIIEKSDKSAVLDDTVRQKRERLSGLDKQITVAKKAAATAEKIDRMADNRSTFGKILMSQEDWGTVSGLAKEALKMRDTTKALQEKNAAQALEIVQQKAQIKELEKKPKIADRIDYYTALQRAPRRMAEVMSDIMRQPPEQQQDRAGIKGKRHTQEL